MRQVALIVESAIAPRREMLTGVARYIQEHEPWAIYLKPLVVEEPLDDWLRHWRGDGIIAAVRTEIRPPLRDRMPIVDIAGLLGDSRLPYVHADDHAIGRLGAEYLLERGFRNLAFVEYPTEFWSAARREAFAATVRAHGHDCIVYPLEYPQRGKGGPRPWERRQEQLAAWIRTLPRPIAIMASNDLMGQQLLEACQRCDSALVPEQIAVLGVDNDEPICRIASPPLSSVIVDDHQRGYEAARLLDRLMNDSGGAAPAESVLVPPVGIRSRASTDVLAIEDDTLVRVMRYIRENACAGITVPDVVRQAPVCRSILERRFRRVFNRTINDEIIRRRLQIAAELVRETELELKAIARRVGFRSQSYMTLMFRRRLGCTPGALRGRPAPPHDATPPPARRP